MDGIIVLNKEKGMTSNDCVIKLKRILHPSKIGHTGTLDPEVTGVLPICLGKATKLVDIMMDQKKTYLATICLGMKTETEDVFGNVIERINVSNILNINECLKSFVGEYMQTPPMYSALKHQGKRLYEYARQGINIEREPRKMHIYDIELVEDILYKDGLAYFKFRVTGSKGLYIRTLCTDIALKLGTIGCMANLVREQTGPFKLREAYTLKDISDGNYTIITIDEYFKNCPSIEVSEYMGKMVKNGIELDERQIITEDYFKVYRLGELIAIYRPIGDNKYKPLIIL